MILLFVERPPSSEKGLPERPTVIYRRTVASFQSWTEVEVRVGTDMAINEFNSPWRLEILRQVRNRPETVHSES